MITMIEGGVCAAKGFTAGGIHAGIKKDPDKKDLAIIYCEKKCNSAALYTTNKVKAAPITVTMKHLTNNQAQAVIVNSGNANACTANGTEIAEKMCDLMAKSLGIDKNDVVVASTGVIGQELNITPFEKGIPVLSAELIGAANIDKVEQCRLACEAIMTTDTFLKSCAVEFELADRSGSKIGGIAKGSGMINPNMGTCAEATMLAFITTDVNISPELLKKALIYVNAKTFNMVSVDGDTSTNDMVCVMASGLAGKVEEGKTYQQFCDALYVVMMNLAKDMARDGEGATKLIECVVNGAKDELTAKSVAKSVISSSLTKAALGAADANWGRILCAIGYAPELGDNFDMNKIEVELASAIGRITVCKDGKGVDFCEDRATRLLSEDEIQILINLNSEEVISGEAGHMSAGSAVAWGCDLTKEYVSINADYRS